MWCVRSVIAGMHIELGFFADIHHMICSILEKVFRGDREADSRSSGQGGVQLV